MFSRNSASSRAIPVSKMLSKVRDTPAEPLWWGKNQSGMQANEELVGDVLVAVQEEWRCARVDALRHAKNLSDLGLHKQCANRRIEADLWTTVIISATELDNFFHQRCHWAAQPEMRMPAEAMKEAYDASTPVLVQEGQWHLPYLQLDEQGIDLETQKQICVARCARVSYLTHDGKRDIDKDLELFGKLTHRESPNEPVHFSPLEHVATPGFSSGNFKGWTQFRAFFEGNPNGVMTAITPAIEQIALNCQRHVLTGTKELEPLIRRAPVGVVEGDQELVYYRITDVIQGALEQLARYGKI
jgi:hypothetical protein